MTAKMGGPSSGRASFLTQVNALFREDLAFQLKTRYGGYYVFTMSTTSEGHDEEVEKMVWSLSPNANKVYHLSGTQKFELPKDEVKIAVVFRAVQEAKKKLDVAAWGLSGTTLEDVFIMVARGAKAPSKLSYSCSFCRHIIKRMGLMS